MSMRKDKENLLNTIDDALDIAGRIHGRTNGLKWTNQTTEKVYDLIVALEEAYEMGENIPDRKKEQ